MKLDEAEQLAQQAFKGYIAGRNIHIPSDVLKSLSIVTRPLDNVWHFEIHSRLPSANDGAGLENDLFYPYPNSVLMVSTDVDRKTGYMELEEPPDVLW